MKAYIATTGILFVLLAVAHATRVFSEPHLARDPWFVLTTVISIALAVWAFRLYRSTSWSQRPPR